MKPSEKSKDIDDFLNATFNINRIDNIEKDTCVFCKKEATKFKTAKSKKEFSISGICQVCQDDIFKG